MTNLSSKMTNLSSKRKVGWFCRLKKIVQKRAKKGQQKVRTLKKTTGLWLSRCYYSILLLIHCAFKRNILCLFLELYNAQMRPSSDRTFFSLMTDLLSWISYFGRISFKTVFIYYCTVRQSEDAILYFDILKISSFSNLKPDPKKH